jgi:hypothetical protein
MSSMLFALLALTTHMVAAVVVSPLIPADGKPAYYHTSFDGHFWNGQKRSFEHDTMIKRTDAGEVTQTVTDLGTGKSSVQTGTLTRDGQIKSADGQNSFDSFNAVASILAGMPANAKVGDEWAAQVPVNATETQTVLVPSKAKIVSVSDGTRIIQASGNVSDTMTYSGFQVPFDLSLRAAVAVASNDFSKADFAFDETVHAGPQTQVLGWKWSFNAKTSKS